VRVGLYGLLGSGNLGNDGSLEAVLGWLRTRHQDAVVDAMCDGPEAVTARWNLPAVRLHWNRREYETASSVGLVARKALGKLIDAVRIAAWVRRHDVVVMGGMGAFENTLPLRPWGTPYSQFLVALFGRMFRTRVALISVGANEVHNPAIRWLFVAAARRVHYLSYRDRYSQRSMRGMGLAERGDRVFPDLVFALPVPPAPSAPHRTGVIGVGVMDYYGSDDDRDHADELNATYLAGIKEIVRSLVGGGSEVRLFIGDAVDQNAVDEILADLREHRPDDVPGRVHAEPATSLHELMDAMTGVDAVIATRFHNVLCALKVAKPTISIGYAQKNVEIMTEMSLGAYCHRADGFDPAAVLGDLEDLDARREELHIDLTARAAGFCTDLDAQFAELDSVLFGDRREEQPPPSSQVQLHNATSATGTTYRHSIQK
jgi:polysaccharide pyruvyl transferase WcaK-like protein